MINLYCPHADLLSKHLSDGHYLPITQDSPRRLRRSAHRELWRVADRNHPSFQEAWRAFNATFSAPRIKL